MQTYPAILIHPDVSGGRCSGDLLIKSDSVFFNSEEKNHEITYANLSIYAGGAGNRFIFFRDGTQEAISIYTSDKSVLKNRFIVSNPNLSKDIRQSKKILNKLLVGTSLLIVLFGLLIAGLYLAKDKMVMKLAMQIPIEWEQKAGDKLFSTMSQQYHFIEHDSLEKEFLTVAAPLFSQIESQGYKVKLYFVKDPTINAFALPGGNVIIQTGLIENAKSWEEVMGVLAHELAHVTQRHHFRGLINKLGVLSILYLSIGDASTLAGALANLGGDLASLSNSRSFEYEADEVGWNYLVNADFNPNGLIYFFETLKKETETEIDSIVNETIDLSFLSTHPDTQNRINDLKQKEITLKQEFDPIPDNFHAFKEAILKIN